MAAVIQGQKEENHFNKVNPEWALCTAVDAAWMLLTYIKWFESLLYFGFQLFTNLHPGKQLEITQEVGALPHMLETQIEFPASDFGLIQPQMLQTFGESTSGQGISECLSLLPMLKLKQYFE